MSIPDRFLLRDIAYQKTLIGLTKVFHKDQKKIWLTFPIKIGICSLTYLGHAYAKANYLDEIWLHTQKYKRHDPKGIVHLNSYSIRSLKYFTHDQ